jgi:hypothetical protein
MVGRKIFSGDGATATFDITSKDFDSEWQPLVVISLDGLVQTADTDYTVKYVSGTTSIAFTKVPAAGATIVVHLFW